MFQRAGSLGYAFDTGVHCKTFSFFLPVRCVFLWFWYITVAKVKYYATTKEAFFLNKSVY